MLLETIDLLTNDVLIYSKNKFDFEKNFKIIYKKDRIKRPQSIDYFEVCKFIKHASPKNIIVYRLLTNVPNLDAYSTKYGYFISVDDRMELIYFDPVFAIEDISHLNFDIEPSKFRFKVQQVGLTYSRKENEEAVYKEVYSFDMKAIEAQNQDDSVFAKAIFALDDSFVDEEENFRTTAEIKAGTKDFLASKLAEIDSLKNLVEAKREAEDNFRKADMPEEIEERRITEKMEQIRDEFNLDWDSKHIRRDGKPKTKFSSFLSQKKQEVALKKGEFNGDLFKGAKFSDRDEVVLKLQDKKK